MQTSIKNANTHFHPDIAKLAGYLTSAVIVVSSNPYVGPSPRIKVSFFYYQNAQISLYQHQK